MPETYDIVVRRGRVRQGGLAMSTRRDLLAGFGVAAGSVAWPIATLLAATARFPLVAFEFDGPGPDVEATLSLSQANGALAPTIGQTQGPFYTPRSPRRRDIRDAFPGDSALIVTGYVLDTRGRPLAGHVLDFWQTDDAARYDGAGYRYRGHQYTDRRGRFELITIAPRPYTAGGQWRTAHVHVKVQGPGAPILTTQIYLPELSELNAVDSVFDPSLAMAESGSQDGARRLRYDFVLADA